MKHNKSIVSLTIVLALTIGGVACSDDSKSSAGGEATEPTLEVTTTEVEAGSDPYAPTETDTTLSPEESNPEAEALRALLSPPAQYGEAVVTDPSQDSPIQTDLCEGVSVPREWTAQASHGMSDAAENKQATLTVTETFLEFPTSDLALAFVEAMAGAQAECLGQAQAAGQDLGDLQRTDRPDIGDGSVVFEVASTGVVVAAGLVRVGPRVASVATYRGQDVPSPLTDEVLGGLATRLTQ